MALAPSLSQPSRSKAISVIFNLQHELPLQPCDTDRRAARLCVSLSVQEQLSRQRKHEPIMRTRGIGGDIPGNADIAACRYLSSQISDSRLQTELFDNRRIEVEDRFAKLVDGPLNRVLRLNERMDGSGRVLQSQHGAGQVLNRVVVQETSEALALQLLGIEQLRHESAYVTLREVHRFVYAFAP